MLGFHPVSSAPVSALTTRPLTASDSPVYAQAKPALSGGKRSGVSNSWVDLGGVVVSSDSSVYAQSSPKPSRLKPLANVWNDRDFASDVPSTIAQAQIKRVANKNSGTSWVDLSDTIVISDAPIYGQANVRTARSKSLSGAWNDVDFASDGLPIVAQSKPQRGFAKSSGAVWFDRDIPDAPIYAQSLAKRIARATTGGAAWTDLSTVVIADDLAVYGQSNARIAKQRINPSVWVDFDTSVAVSSDLSPYSQSIPRRKQLSTNSYGWVDYEASIAAPSDLSPYAQSIRQRKQLSTNSYAWGDLDTSIAASSDLSPYAQSLLRKKSALAGSAAWVNPDQDDAPVYAQGVAKQRSASAYSRYWVDLDLSVSSDLSPYAQTNVSRVTRDAKLRNTGTVWNSADKLAETANILTVRKPISRLAAGRSHRHYSIPFRYCGA